jgi:type IV pilus assembly protein PilX
MRLPSDRLRSAAAQQGFVLITSLVFLVVLSLLSVMAMRGTLFDERMAANDRDRALAKEYAEMALRDAERDILGLRFDGATYCRDATGAALCTLARPAGTRPASNLDAANFWIAANPNIDDIGLEDGGRTLDIANQGVDTAFSADACGRPVWSGADWQDGANPARSCAGTIGYAVPTVPYGRFTDAPFVGPDGAAPRGIPPPRYLIEMFKADDLNIPASNKLFFRITAVGFGRTTGPTGRTSVTLQSVFSPL